MPRGRPSNREERRGQIVRALLTAMARSGYDGASIADIAALAGLAPGLVHYHFASKQEVLLALIEHLASAVRERARERVLAAGEDPLARLDAFISVHLARGPGEEPEWVAAWVAIGAEAIRTPAVREVYRRAVAASLADLERLVLAARKAAKAPARGARAAACALLAAIEGYYLLAAAVPGMIPEGSAAPLVRLAARALVGDGRAGARP